MTTTLVCREYVVALVVLGSTRHAPSTYRSGDEICPGGTKNEYALPRSEEGRCAPPRPEEREMRAATVGGREMRAATVELRSGAAWRRRHTLRVRLRVIAIEFRAV